MVYNYRFTVPAAVVQQRTGIFKSLRCLYTIPKCSKQCAGDLEAKMECNHS